MSPVCRNSPAFDVRYWPPKALESRIFLPHSFPRPGPDRPKKQWLNRQVIFDHFSDVHLGEGREKGGKTGRWVEGRRTVPAWPVPSPCQNPYQMCCENKHDGKDRKNRNPSRDYRIYRGDHFVLAEFPVFYFRHHPDRCRSDLPAVRSPEMDGITRKVSCRGCCFTYRAACRSYGNFFGAVTEGGILMRGDELGEAVLL